MQWRITRHTKNEIDLTETIYCELWLSFHVNKTDWNKKEERPVMKIIFRDYKKETGWWLDLEKTKWYTHKPHAMCEIQYNYFESHPKVKIYAEENSDVSYENFTLEYCKNYAVKIFKERMLGILKQLDLKRIILIEKIDKNFKCEIEVV